MRRTSVDVVLEATAAAVLDVGVRRTTFAEVSRRAGVSRATLYTHFAGVDQAVTALLTRELGAVLAAAAGERGTDPPLLGGSRPDVGGAHHVPGERSARGRLLAAVARVLAVLPDHPLFRKVVEVDADLLLPYVVSRLGTVQQLALAQLLGWITDGQADGSVRDGDPDALATTVMLAVQSVLLASHAGQVPVDRAALHTTLLDTIDRGLRP